MPVFNQPMPKTSAKQPRNINFATTHRLAPGISSTSHGTFDDEARPSYEFFAKQTRNINFAMAHRLDPNSHLAPHGAFGAEARLAKGFFAK